jgi:hypothetical protein
MLSEKEIRERAEYCYLVFLQLSRLLSNDFIEPAQYLECLKKSSLGLGDDAFIIETIQESLMMGREDGGLTSLLNIYEGFFTAFCEVLEIDSDDIRNGLSPDDLEKLASEMDLRKKSAS